MGQTTAVTNASYDKASSDLAWQRSLAFFGENLKA